MPIFYAKSLPPPTINVIKAESAAPLKLEQLNTEQHPAFLFPAAASNQSVYRAHHKTMHHFAARTIKTLCLSMLQFIWLREFNFLEILTMSTAARAQ